MSLSELPSWRSSEGGERSENSRIPRTAMTDNLDFSNFTMSGVADNKEGDGG